MEDIVIGELTLVNFNSNDKTHLMTLKKLAKDSDITSRFNGFLQHLNNKNSNFFNKGFFVRDEENLIGYIDLSNFNEEEKEKSLKELLKIKDYVIDIKIEENNKIGIPEVSIQTTDGLVCAMKFSAYMPKIKKIIPEIETEGRFGNCYKYAYYISLGLPFLILITFPSAFIINPLFSKLLKNSLFLYYN